MTCIYGGCFSYIEHTTIFLCEVYNSLKFSPICIIVTFSDSKSNRVDQQMIILVKVEVWNQ